VERLLKLQDEELQMLWWLVGEMSWEFDKAFNSLPIDSKPLVLAKELAGMTNFIPGPVSLKPLLSRAGITKKKKLTIPEAINSCDESWLNGITTGLNPSSLTLPIHFAIIRKVETGEKEAWIPGWAASTKIEATRKLSSLDLGYLFYLERLLVRFFKE
jgi:hypothetical protein